MSNVRSAPRIKRESVLQVIEQRGGATRDALAAFFECTAPTIETHLVNLKCRGEILVGDWDAPKKSGQWSPVWVKRTSATQTSPARPTRKVKERAPVIEEDEDDMPVVQARGAGVRQEHALMARARGVVVHDNDTFAVGPWAGLVASRRVAGATSAGEAAQRAYAGSHA